MPDFDSDKRRRKGEKIVRTLLRERPHIAETKPSILDIGCGSGHITQMLRRVAGAEGSVSGCDLCDQRTVVSCDFEFRLSGPNGLIPWPDATFDVAIDNFVLEHVGPASAQAEHIAEIARILKPGGLCYLAVPNAWWIVEAHTHLWFVTWLPERWQAPYVRRRIDYAPFGTWTPTRSRIRRFTQATGLALHETTLQTLRDYVELEKIHGLARAMAGLPDWCLRPLLGMIPSMTFILARPDTDTPRVRNGILCEVGPCAE